MSFQMKGPLIFQAGLRLKQNNKNNNHSNNNNFYRIYFYKALLYARHCCKHFPHTILTHLSFSDPVS